MDDRVAEAKVDISGQAVLEAAIVFIVMALLLVGVVRIWLWSSAQIPIRQKNYENTRFKAGAAQPGMENPYKKKALTDDWVFGGKP